MAVTVEQVERVREQVAIDFENAGVWPERMAEEVTEPGFGGPTHEAAMRALDDAAERVRRLPLDDPRLLLIAELEHDLAAQERTEPCTLARIEEAAYRVSAGELVDVVLGEWSDEARRALGR